MESQDVLDFWFEGELLGEAQVSRWWKKNDAVDQDIKVRFSTLVQQVYEHLGDTWSNTPEGRLASIICLDQFPRNIYRNRPEAFSYDHEALRLCHNGIQINAYQELSLIQQSFFVMPLMHSESLSDQNTCVAHFSRLVDQAEGDLARYLSGSLDFAKQHRDIIERFNRYPPSQ